MTTVLGHRAVRTAPTWAALTRTAIAASVTTATVRTGRSSVGARAGCSAANTRITSPWGDALQSIDSSGTLCIGIRVAQVARGGRALRNLRVAGPRILNLVETSVGVTTVALTAARFVVALVVGDAQKHLALSLGEGLDHVVHLLAGEGLVAWEGTHSVVLATGIGRLGEGTGQQEDKQKAAAAWLRE